MNTANNPTNTTTEIKYHTPVGIYDTELIQLFENVRDRLLASGMCNKGICYITMFEVRADQATKLKGMEIIESYMPHKEQGEFWWPIWSDADCELEGIEQGFYDRVAFLDRIIEDLMCGV